MSKFTAGKWTYDTPSGCVHCEGKLIADVAGAGGANYQHDKGQANARLIASAPVMYELLKVWVNLQAQPPLMEARKRAQELLAHIDGEEEEG